MTIKSMKIAAIGTGVIGAGWVARFLLNGHDVTVFDPGANAEQILSKVIANATRAYQTMTLAPLPPKGRLVMAKTIEEAVREADYIQESVPERLDLKIKTYLEIEKFAKADAVLASSTSGFKPSQLIEGLGSIANQLLVAHPFNPVYLLPVVEIVKSPKTKAAIVDKAQEILTSIGMKPLMVRKEIDAHIADRLLEAVWREGLWLVHDDVATTTEIDDVITYGFGLRWAQMGLFETYRIAGGEAGMRHFLGQFGPALKWPWTKLMDVPELSDGLIDKITTQSDAQSGQYDIVALERIRDDNLVAIMQALKGQKWGAGNTLINYENGLYDQAHEKAENTDSQINEPLHLHSDRVREDFVDYNGHMTESRYLQVFGDATDAFLKFIGVDKDYFATGKSIYTAESHIRHLNEAKMGETLAIETRLLGFDGKRIRIVHEMYRAKDHLILATAEHMLLHVDTQLASVCVMEAPLQTRLAQLWQGQQQLSSPDYAGQPIRDIVMQAASG